MFSIIIPICNVGERAIRYIASIKNNTYGEVIIIDDGFTHNTEVCR